MTDRTLGWVQNPSSFENLINVVSVFDKSTKMYKEIFEVKIKRLVEEEELREKLLLEMKREPLSMRYSLLKGRGIAQGTSRKTAACSGLVQLAITTQKGREYTDDWTADGFIRWGISIGLLDYDSSKDEVAITKLGSELVCAKTPDEVERILITAFLSYPPAVRVLHLLEDNSHLTKFEIGSRLGGLGEPGFTSIPQSLYVQAIAMAIPIEKAKIRANTEGSADKYARMIATWLAKVGLVQRIEKEVSTKIGNQEYRTKIGHAYIITLRGLKELKREKGLSSYKKINKIVYWQMLATKGNDRDYIRSRRGHLINVIKGRWLSIEEIREYMEKKGLFESGATIKDELGVLLAMGISVNKGIRGYNIDDNIVKLEIPRQKITKTNLLALKDKVRNELLHINHRYLSLIDLAYDGNMNRDFEMQTIDLLTNELSFDGIRLGGSRKPDGIIYSSISGVIIDNKAYSDGYNLPIGQADEMIRYIEENKSRDTKVNDNEWWKNFHEKVTDFKFLFISSMFKGGFKKNLQYIADRTGVDGGAINVENLLYLAEQLKSGKVSYEEQFKLFKNKEIAF